MFSDLKFRLRSIFNRRAMELELDNELRFHLEHEIDKLERAGLSPADAERRARLDFGGLDRIKDDARDARGVSVFENLGQDLRYALRGMRIRPGFTAAVITTLGLGLGANAVMFGIVDRMLFRPPAYLSKPVLTHRLFIHYMWSGKPRSDRYLDYTRYTDFAKWTTKFDVIAAVAERNLAVGTGDESRELNVGTFSANTFRLFDARPVLGRFFTEDEDRVPNGAPVAVLSHRYWQTQFAGHRDVLGKSIRVDKATYTIIGVAPASFVAFSEVEAPSLFIPITAYGGSRNQDYMRTYNWSWLEIFASRKPGVSIEEADADLSSAFVRSWDAERELGDLKVTTATAKPYANVTPVLSNRGPDASADAKVVSWVMGVAVIVLLIACANVANLLLAQAVKRRREIAIRLALGVDRARLLQQLLTESLLIAALGGAAGLAVAQWGGGAIRGLFLRAEDATAVITDWRTLAFAVLVTIGVALLTGVAPALHALRADVSGALKAGAREGTFRRSRVRAGLLVFQGALSVLLLVGAGLFVRSLQHVRSVRMGYDADSLVYLEFNSRSVQMTKADAIPFNARLVAVAAAVPGVRSVTHTVSVPFFSSEGRGSPRVAGRDSLGKLGRYILQSGSTNYFETVGTRIVRGRGFTADDRAESPPIVVISEAMAKAIWPNEDAIGQRMRFGNDTTPELTVVGIAENIRGFRLQGEYEFWWYIPTPQFTKRYGEEYTQFFVRVSGRADELAETVRRRLQKEMPGDAYITARPLTQAVEPQQRSWRFGATMFAAFGGLAMLLAAIGLYSVVAYAVAQRTHELGVRIALGAGVGDITRMIVGQGLAFATSGIVIGSAIALLAAKRIEPLLFAQSARDPVVFGTVAAVLLAAAVAATLRPALRAARVDPTEALRGD